MDNYSPARRILKAGHTRFGTRFFLCLSIQLLLTLVLPGQSSYVIENYTNDNGLPQNSVLSIQVDSAGYCWLATQMGLVRWDGRNFKTYNGSDIPGVDFLSVRSMAQDGRGNIYVCLNIVGYPTLKINGIPGLTAPSPQKMQTRQDWIFNNGWWIGNELMQKVRMPEAWKKIAAKLADIPSDRTVFTLPGNNRFYIIAEEAAIPYLYYMANDNAQKLKKIFQRYGAFITVDNTLAELDGTDTVTLWEEGRMRKQPAVLLGGLYNDKNYRAGTKKLLWCVTGSFVYCENNLYKLFLENGVLKSQKVLSGVTLPDIKCIYYLEAYDIYLLGSDTKGLFVVHPKSFTYPALPATSLNENFYSQLLIDSISLFSKDILISRQKPPKSLPLGSEEARALYRSGEYMFFEKASSLYRYSFKTGKTAFICHLDSVIKGVLRSGTDSSVIYFCTQRNSLGAYSLANPNKTPVFKKLFNDRFFSGMEAVGRDSFLLFTDRGLIWYDVKNDHVYKKMLEQVSIRNIYYEPDGKIWIAAYGKGIMLVDKEAVYTFPSDSRRALRVLHGFIEDGRGNFWMPTNDGLLKVSKAELLAFAAGTTKNVYYYRYDKTLGLRINEFNGGCQPFYIRFPDSLLSLPSIDGLVWFHPDKVKTIYPAAAIYIEQVKLDDSLCDVNMGKIVLPPDFKRLHIKAGSPYFGIRDNQRIQYMVEELNNTWTDLPEDGMMLNNIQAGTYTMVLRKHVGRYVEDFIYTRLVIKVQPWFYNTWWFRSLIIGLIIIAIFFIASYRERLLKARARKLEQEVADRTSELNNTVIDLKQSEDALKESTAVKDMMTTLILHDLRSPLRFMDVLIQHIAGNIKEEEQIAVREEIKALQKTSQSLSGFSQTFFTWATSQHAGFKVINTRFPLQQVLDELVLLYEPISAVKGNTIQTVANNIVCNTDKNILSTILRNLLDNANKNNTGTIIAITAATGKTTVSITVADNGAGMEESVLTALRNGLAPDASGNMGYRMITDLTKKIGATLHIDSKLNEGTRVTLVFENTI